MLLAVRLAGPLAMTIQPGARCGKCRKVHRTHRGSTNCCIGHRSKARGGAPCSKAPMHGQRVCDTHGGKAAQNRQAAAERIARAEAEKLAFTLGQPVPGDPADIIAERIAARNGHVRWLLARVQALEPEALTWGLTKRKTAVGRPDTEAAGDEGRRNFAGTDEGDTLEAKPHIWYALYIDAADRLERLCIEAVRVGLEERRVRIDERMADMWVRVIDGVLAELGHDPNDPATAEVVARHLELVA